MFIRSGISTLGANYTVSVIKNSDKIKTVVGDAWDPVNVITRDSKEWLEATLERETNVEHLIKQISGRLEESEPLEEGSKQVLSLAQLCELQEHKRVLELMDTEEKIHVSAHMGSFNSWVTVLPLEFKGYALSPSIWLAAVRRRLNLDVAPVEAHCRFCKTQICDVKGTHAITCKNSLTIRHNQIRDLIAKELKSCGYSVGIEHKMPGKQKRPGDVIVHNWDGTRALLLDVAIINPLNGDHRQYLAEGGAGAAATVYEQTKWNTYPEYKNDGHLSENFIFMPIVFETSGGVSKTAHKFAKIIEAKRKLKLCSSATPDKRTYPNRLLTNINIQVQHINGTMIIDREPEPEALRLRKLVVAQIEASHEKQNARERVQGVVQQPEVVNNPVRPPSLPFSIPRRRPPIKHANNQKGFASNVGLPTDVANLSSKLEKIPQQIANAMELGEVQTTSAPSSSAKPVQLAPSVATQHKDNQIGLERATVTPVNKPPTTTKPKPTPPTETKHQGVKPHTQKPLVASLHSEKPQQNPKTSAPSGEQTKTQKQPPSPGKHSPENNQNLGKGESSEDEW